MDCDVLEAGADIRLVAFCKGVRLAVGVKTTEGRPLWWLTGSFGIWTGMTEGPGLMFSEATGPWRGGTWGMVVDSSFGRFNGCAVENEMGLFGFFDAV